MTRRRKKRPQQHKPATAAALKKAQTAQIWVTVLWQDGCDLPWAFRRGPSGKSEREHLANLIAELPRRSMVTAGAGFAGYDYWRELLEAGHDFIIRVGTATITPQRFRRK